MDGSFSGLILLAAVALAAFGLRAQTPAAGARLWVDVTATAIGATKYWTNKVEIADLNGDGRLDG
jgi:hypothetical protein